MSDLDGTSNVKRALSLLAFCAVVGLTVLFCSPTAMNQASGVVVSSGPIATSGVDGGIVEMVLVRLANGQEVYARVQSGGPFTPGNAVSLLREQRTPADSYVVTGKIRK